MSLRPDFNDTQKWVTRPGVWIFDEHRRKFKEPSGKVHKEDFNRQRLQRIANKMNALDRAGTYCPLTLGHTVDDLFDDDGKLTYKAKESDQPETVGYADGYEVAWHEGLQRYAIRTKYRLRRDRFNEAQSYPFSSVEIWTKRDQFHPIALLRRTPQRDLGSWTYRRGGHFVLRYSMDEFDDLQDEPGRPGIPPGLAAGGSEEGGPPEEDDAHDPVAPPADSGEGGGLDALGGGDEGMEGDDERMDDGPPDVDPEDWMKYKRCYRHGASEGGYHAKYSSQTGGGPAAGGDTPQASPGDAVIKPNKMRRGAQQAPQKGTQKLKPKDQERMQRGTIQDMLLRMQRSSEKFQAEMRREIAAVRGESENLKYQRDLAQVEQILDKVEQVVSIDRAYQAEMLMGMDAEKREGYAEQLMQYGRPDPAKVRMVSTEQAPLRMERSGVGPRERVTVTGGTGRADTGFGDQHLEKANKYMRAHPGCDWDEAMEYVRGKRTLEGQATNGRR